LGEKAGNDPALGAERISAGRLRQHSFWANELTSKNRISERSRSRDVYSLLAKERLDAPNRLFQHGHARIREAKELLRSSRPRKRPKPLA
jgi:hypothetical protein